MTRVGVRAPAVVAAAQLLLTGCVVAAGSSGDDSGASFFFLVLPFALLLFVVGLSRRRGRSSRRHTWASNEPAETTNEQVLRAELSVLADDIVRLDPQVALKEEARDDYEAATHRYRVAQAALDYADQPLDLVRVQRVVDEANWSMSRARAVLAGRRPPDPPEPLRHPGPHGEPALGVGHGHRPVYVDSPAGFRSGWFSGGGGLFSGLLMGSMLAGFGGGWVEDEHADDDDGADNPDATGW